VSKKLRWRGFIVLLVIALALIYLTPSISKTLPSWWPNILPEEKIHLGLDLKGGMHLVLEGPDPEGRGKSPREDG